MDPAIVMKRSYSGPIKWMKGYLIAMRRRGEDRLVQNSERIRE